MSLTEWLPQYTIKRHWRAKFVKMTFSKMNGLEITIPKRFSTKHLPGILEEHKEWILKQKNKYTDPAMTTRPAEIYLRAFNQQYTVHYFQNDKALRVKALANHGIILSGDINDFYICRDKLEDWLKKQAKTLLIPYFNKLALESGMIFRDVSVRSQTTLWGSCSHDKSIRLNYKLIFLPEPLMRHIMIHELCHTRYMNHSEKFWQLVANYDQDWRAHKLAMRKAEKYMPAWI